ncbi:MAG: DEAD/DEAH box helicase [Gemmatimonadetes bacterium]|nr:DEAD/DEAH box helicase [Gemmatimonadota bacterium]
MVKLRPYQQDLLQQVQDTLDADYNARVMMQLPTGGGKTIIAGALLAAWLTGGRKAVWLTHRKELAEQTCKMLTDAHISAMTDVNWTPGTDAPSMSHGVVILMAQTVGRRTANREVWDRYNADDLMVIDEAHHAVAKSWERAMRQWPGRILGMTATPWRLSKKEGFDHLFGALLGGPQVAELQGDNWLCGVQTLLPPPEQRIIGGEVDRTGDYTESGIEQANQNRSNVMTAGVLAFWQKHAVDRPTIAYAVSVDHAHNLSAVFNDAGIPAAVILGDSKREERDKSIAGFRDGTIKVLINVIVATEGFDLPDASCIAIARPTMSLALYLQMVGRGLRPKDSNCLVLDLAANSVTHGLPEEDRGWSLKPRGEQFSGEAPVVWCPECETVSPAASHHCRNCGYAFGKDCGRCGKWRAWKRWRFEDFCGNVHQLVCDLCHIDAHIQAHLPVTEPLDKLIDIYEDTEDNMIHVPSDDDLANRLSSLLKELLETERQSVMGANVDHQLELFEKIERREAELNDDDRLYESFERYIAHLPEAERPGNMAQKSRMFGDWENDLKSELAVWKKELTELENRPIDKQAIFNSARNKVMHLLQRKAQDIDLLPDSNGDGPPPPPPSGYDHLRDYLIPIIQLMKNGKSHTETFHARSEKLGVTYGTVSARCTRDLGFSSVSEFIEHVESGRIIRIIKNKFPEDIGLIDKELMGLFENA